MGIGHDIHYMFKIIISLKSVALSLYPSMATAIVNYLIGRLVPITHV